MPKLPIPSDATIRDVLPMLADAEEYVRVVLGHLSACFKQHGSAHVRIGVTGKGLFPSHKVQYRDPAGEEHLFDAYAERVSFGDCSISVENWSSSSMSFEEVKDLMGEIRGFHRSGAARR